MLKGRSLRFKLISLSMFLAGGTLLVGLLASLTLARVGYTYQQVSDVSFMNYRLMASMRYAATDFARAYLRLSVPGNTPETIKRLKDTIKSDLETYAKTDKAYNEIPFRKGKVTSTTPWTKLGARGSPRLKST